jgi:hypothetical protein
MKADVGRRALFLAIAVCEYEDERWETLKTARAAVARLAEIMDEAGYEVRVLWDPSYAEVAAGLDAAAWKNGGFRGPLVLAWVGHGENIDDELGLAVFDTPRSNSFGQRHRPRDLARFTRNSGSTDTLILFDTCSAGAGDAEVLAAAIRSDNQSTQAGRPPRLGIAVSSKAYQPAFDGVFVKALADLLTDGPSDADEAGDYAPLWTSSHETVPVGAVLYALITRRIAGQNPRAWPAADSTIRFPNPKHVKDTEPALTSERLAQSYNEEQVSTTVVRTPAIEALSARIDEPSPGLWLIIGSAGVGKTTCLTTATVGASGEPVIVPVAHGLAAVRQALEYPASGPVLVDGLDEAPHRDLEPILEAAIRGSRSRFVVVATRPTALDAIRPGLAGRGLIGAEQIVELDDEDWLRPAITTYVAERLREAS